MANTQPSTTQRSPRRSRRGVTWMSERQLDAYLQARETLRRLRAVTAPSVAIAAAPRHGSSSSPRP
jgi:hypothetical protein